MTTNSLATFFRAACIAALALALAGCLIRSDSDTQTTGRQVSPETLSKVKSGSSEEYVLALLGEPTSKTPTEAGHQIWKWEYTEVKRSEGGVFLVFSADSSKHSSDAVFVEFQDGHVVTTWRD